MKPENTAIPGGLAGWLLARWHHRGRTQRSLALLERISLAPRQNLCLVEAEGRRFLIASSPEGAPAFYPLEPRSTKAANQPAVRRRITW